MLKLFKNFRPRDFVFLLIMTACVISSVWAELTMPDYTSQLTKLVTTASMGGQVTMDDVWYNGGMMLLCAFASLAAMMGAGFFSAIVSADFAKITRTKLFEKISSFSSAEINRFSTASLITRTTNDVVQLQNFLAMGIRMLIKAPVLAIWAICKISFTNLGWTMATLICVAVIVALIAVLVGICFPLFKKIQKLTDDLNNVTRETVSGVRVVRAFNAESYQSAKFKTVNDAVTKNQLTTNRLMSLMFPAMMLGMNVLTIAIYWIGALLINDTDIMGRAQVLGDMTAFTSVAMQVVMAFMMLIFIIVMSPRVMVSAKRINEVLETKPSIVGGDLKQADEKGTLEFRNVSFKYEEGGDDVLTDVSFSMKQGETLAIIGATGSGKSTIINLISRFYDVSGGEVLFDGHNVKEYDLEFLREKIAVANQKAVLFKGDIKTNVTYGVKEEIKDEDPRIQEALDVACATFVSELENGIHSEVAQGGHNFSGGQKQRLSIARTVFKKGELIIFDDSFSALDYKTDLMVRRNLREKLSDTSIIIVAQRIGTIRQADRIIVLDEGKVAGIGTHDELMKNCEVYQQIALSQLNKEEL